MCWIDATPFAIMSPLLSGTRFGTSGCLQAAQCCMKCLLTGISGKTERMHARIAQAMPSNSTKMGKDIVMSVTELPHWATDDSFSAVYGTSNQYTCPLPDTMHLW
jgi:hypothetical protein